MLEAPNWFKETIKTQVHHREQGHGPYLEGTMMRGDIDGGTIKFPRMGPVKAYEIFGTIENIDVQEAALDTITANFRDFELPIRYRTQDGWDMGPMQQAAYAKAVTAGINEQKDKVKLQALHAFRADLPGEVDTLDETGNVIDIMMVDELISDIAAEGWDEDDEIYLPLPDRLMTQLLYYKEFNTSEWVGNADLGFAKKSKVKKRMRNGCHIFTMPDRLFTQADASNWLLPMWSKSCMGQEARTKGDPIIWKEPKEKGTPIYYKDAFRDCAVGIEPKGVKFLICSKSASGLARPA